jgi:hypothetical protein
MTEEKRRGRGRPARPNLPVNQTLLSEVMKRVMTARSVADKEEVLKKYDSKALRTVLLLSYAYSIKFDLPDGKTPYRANESPEGLNHQYLFHVYGELERFITKTFPNGLVLYGDSGKPVPYLGKTKKEQMWIQLMESLHADEAELLDVIKDKKISERYQLTRATVDRAFPELKLGEEKKPEAPKKVEEEDW